jgi:hypothetical protein
MSLMLGPVVFGAFELPASIGFGGRQRLAVHQLPGGDRVVDAMGRDDAPICWNGAFSGPDATPRALMLNLLRAQGAALPLTWDVFAFTVVIAEFTARYDRQNWIPYRITCSVVADDSFPSVILGTPVLSSILGDLAIAGGAGLVNVAAATSALGATDALAVGTPAWSAAGMALAAATAGVGGALANAGTALAAATSFPAAASAAGQCAQLANAQGYVRRAQTNFINAGA